MQKSRRDVACMNRFKTEPTQSAPRVGFIYLLSQIPRKSRIRITSHQKFENLISKPLYSMRLCLPEFSARRVDLQALFTLLSLGQ